jgi:hypothetical protein
MHYTASNKATTDRTNRLTFMNATEDGTHHIASLLNPKPPAGGRGRRSGRRGDDAQPDMTVYSMLPHARPRPQVEVTVTYRTATVMVLAVPNYDFNWQTGTSSEPLKLPGARGPRPYDTTGEQDESGSDEDVQRSDVAEMQFTAFTLAWTRPRRPPQADSSVNRVTRTGSISHRVARPPAGPIRRHRSPDRR